MKKILLNFKTLAILVVMCLAGTLGISAYDFPDYEHGMYFNYLDDGTCEVTYYDESYGSYSGNVSIPAVAVRGALNQVEFDVTRIGNSAFRQCPNLTSVSIPTSITSIGQSAFSYSHQLTSVTIPYSVKTIEFNAFGDCNGLRTVHIGSGVTNIAAYGFDSPLTTVYCYATTPPTIANENAFKSTTYSGATLYVPNPSSRYKYYRSFGWTNFQTVRLINNYDFVYSGIYYTILVNDVYNETGNCSVSRKNSDECGYTSTTVTIPSIAYYNSKSYNVTKIEAYALEGCTSVRSVTIPNSVTWIQNNAFQNCSNLNTLVIGSGCNSINYAAFYGCPSLTSITCYATTPPNITQGATAFNNHNATLYVPAGSIEAYKTAVDWKLFTNIKMIPGTGLEINATNFPDANFRSYLLSKYPSGYITNEEIAALTTMDVSSRGIADLTGIKYFTALKTLRCYNNPLTSLDMSNCTALTYLDCAPTSSYTGTKLTSLNVSGCTNLETLYCYNTNISSLDVTPCKSLRELDCHNCPYLTTLSVIHKSDFATLKCANCTNLNKLYCYGNHLMTTLDVTGNTALKDLRCYNADDLTKITGLADCTAITYLDCEDCKIADLSAVNTMSNIEKLYCRNNQLTSLTVNGKSKLTLVRAKGNTQMTTADIYSNSVLADLDISYCSALTNLKCYSNALTALNVTGNTALKALRCYYNYNLAAITGLANCTAITYLDCEDCAITDLSAVNSMSYIEDFLCRNNKLTSLTLTNKSKLTYVRAQGNKQMTTATITANSKLETLDIGSCTALKTLNCYNNALTTLDVSADVALTSLSCYNNKLTSLIVSAFTNLSSLQCYKNQLSSLNLTNNTKLTSVNCGENNLSTLNVSGKTTLVSLGCYDNQLTSLNVQGCTALTTLSCVGNKLTSLNVQGCNALNDVKVSRNQFTDAGMTTLINSLPTRSSSNPGVLGAINVSGDENNVFTATHFAAAQAKYWKPKKWNGSSWVDITFGGAKGDVNGDGLVNISDATALVNYLLKGNSTGINLGNSDCNNDGQVNISDATVLINYLLQGHW